LRVGLTRLVTPGGLARLVAPTLPEVAVAVSPAVAIAAASAAGATVVAVASAAQALVAKQLELVAVLSAVGVRVVVGAERAADLLGLIAFTAAFLLGLRREHGRALALGIFVLSLGGVWHRVGVVVGKETAFFGLGAPVGKVEQLEHGVELIVDGELLAHPDFRDAVGECGDDGGLGGTWDL
jgi:hypothetical protein